MADLKTFDITEMLDSEQAIAEYLTIVLEENDAAALADALGTVARARGMTAVAQDAGLAREALYKALRAGAHPRFDTIQRVMAALGVRLAAMPIR
ncbi:MAG: putative addiction module antidote protein [Dokdonella sp.]|uniref:addiction module antidote protein n=1 Tax=Dokdonella sp. TaxID=2291710 RepID=UPI0025C31CB7|nr:addiction module antidote protein [Dokdonella sp.]MBZ0221935.1 putative addiction module antidote protein [Dokdonella sp.]